MKLSEITKQMIREEYNEFKAQMYAGKSLAERKALGQFFTPPEYVIAMIEKFDCNEAEFSKKAILDPCCGSGNLLMGCLIAGAEPCNLYGNDYDVAMVEVCRKRLNNYISNYCTPKNEYNLNINIHWGNALVKKCITQFDEEYTYNPEEDEAMIAEQKKEERKKAREAKKAQKALEAQVA